MVVVRPCLVAHNNRAIVLDPFWETWGVFHLPRDSGNSGWVVNET